MGTSEILPVLLPGAAAVVAAVSALSLSIFILGLIIGYRMSRGMSPLGVPQFLRMGKDKDKPASKLPAITG